VKQTLNQFQFDALVSFVFNVGKTNFENSTLLKVLNAGNLDAVPSEMLKWFYAKKQPLDGLKVRRASEAKLWVVPADAMVSVADNGDVSVHSDSLTEPAGTGATTGGAGRMSNVSENPPFGRSTMTGSSSPSVR